MSPLELKRAISCAVLVLLLNALPVAAGEDFAEPRKELRDQDDSAGAGI